MSRLRTQQADTYWIVVAALVLGDQIIKYLSSMLTRPIELGPLSIGRVINTAGVFGLQLRNTTLILLSIMICIGLAVALARQAGSPPLRLGMWLLLGGAASNVIDRLTTGGVIDVIAIGGLSRFNLADVMILLGALSCVRGLWWRRT